MGSRNRHFDPPPPDPDARREGWYSDPGWPLYDASKNHPYDSLMELEGRCLHCGLRSEAAVHKRPWADPAPMRPAEPESFVMPANTSDPSGSFVKP